jgi:germination protein YpeB
MKREFAKHDCCKNIVESDKHDCCKKFDECDKSAFYKAFEEYDKNAFCKEFEECEKKGSGCEKNPANNPQVENYDGSIISVSADMFEDFEGDSDEKYFRGQSISAAKNGTSSYDKQAEELHERVEMLNLKIKKAAENLKRDYSMLKGLKNGLFVGFDLSDKNEEEPSDVPQLIYDGPFSDGQNAKNYKGLEGKEEIDLEKAKQILTERFASLEIKEISSLGEASDPDAFLLTSDTKNGNMFASVAKKGGVILAAICDSPSKQENLNLSEEDAKEKAMEYAKMCGFDGLSPVWISESQGYAVVNLTPIKDNIVFYPDLVKVKICMASGDFEGIETVGYCASHTQRSLSPTISESEAQAVVSSKLQLSGSRLAVIPKDQKELLCYEFTGSYKGLDYFVYIDAASGKQANIMRVINDEQGKMVM